MMRKTGFSKVSWLGLLAGLLGYFFNATMRSGGSAIPLIAFSVLMALVFWLSAATLEKRARYDEVFHVMRLDFALTVLACIVVFCTTYALVLPALTLTGGTFCGKEEHCHSDECCLISTSFLWLFLREAQ